MAADVEAPCEVQFCGHAEADHVTETGFFNGDTDISSRTMCRRCHREHQYHAPIDPLTEVPHLMYERWKLHGGVGSYNSWSAWDRERGGFYAGVAAERERQAAKRRRH